MTTRPMIVARITGGLVAGGAVAGGVCTWLTVSAFLTAMEGVAAIGQLFSGAGVWLFLLGGALGAVATPILFWSVLRHVPFGTVLKVGIPFTVAGAMVGEWLRPFQFGGSRLQGVVLGAFAGFALAGLVARVLAARRPRA